MRETIKALRGFRWSSYRGYVGLEKRKKWVTYETLDGQVKARFGKQKGVYRKYVESGLAEDDEELREAMGSSRGWVLGSAEFISDMKDRYQSGVEGGVRKREDVLSVTERTRLGSGEILDAVMRGLRIGREDLMRRRGGGEYRGIAARMLVKYGGLTQRETAEVLGLTTGAAISRQQKALEERLKRHCSLARRVQGIESDLGRL